MARQRGKIWFPPPLAASIAADKLPSAALRYQVWLLLKMAFNTQPKRYYLLKTLAIFLKFRLKARYMHLCLALAVTCESSHLLWGSIKPWFLQFFQLITLGRCDGHLGLGLGFLEVFWSAVPRVYAKINQRIVRKWEYCCRSTVSRNLNHISANQFEVKSSFAMNLRFDTNCAVLIDCQQFFNCKYWTASRKNQYLTALVNWETLLRLVGPRLAGVKWAIFWKYL